MDSEIENRIEELIDQKLGESEGEVNRKKLKREIIDELKQDNEVELDAELSRRSFLKTLGLGAGGLAFSSLAASANWALWQPQSDGKSDINADALDGSSVGDLAGNQLSASGGSLNLNEGSGSGLDADTVDGQEASEIGGGSGPHRDLSGDVFTETSAVYSNQFSLSAPFQTANTSGYSGTQQRAMSTSTRLTNISQAQSAYIRAGASGSCTGPDAIYIYGTIDSDGVQAARCTYDYALGSAFPYYNTNTSGTLNSPNAVTFNCRVQPQSDSLNSADMDVYGKVYSASGTLLSWTTQIGTTLSSPVIPDGRTSNFTGASVTTTTLKVNGVTKPRPGYTGISSGDVLSQSAYVSWANSTTGTLVQSPKSLVGNQ